MDTREIQHAVLMRDEVAQPGRRAQPRAKVHQAVGPCPQRTLPPFGGWSHMTGAELVRRYRDGARDFGGVELQDEDLSNVTLAGAKFVGAAFKRVTPAGTIFGDSDLSWAQLKDANLTGVRYTIWMERGTLWRVTGKLHFDPIADGLRLMTMPSGPNEDMVLHLDNGHKWHCALKNNSGDLVNRAKRTIRFRSFLSSWDWDHSRPSRFSGPSLTGQRSQIAMRSSRLTSRLNSAASVTRSCISKT